MMEKSPVHTQLEAARKCATPYELEVGPYRAESDSGNLRRVGDAACVCCLRRVICLPWRRQESGRTTASELEEAWAD